MMLPIDLPESIARQAHDLAVREHISMQRAKADAIVARVLSPPPVEGHKK